MRPSNPDAGFLRREGAQLLLGGKPFRAVGVNKHELLDLYLADFWGRDLKGAIERARRSLDILARIGVNVVRARASPFWPAQIEDTYLRRPKVFWQRFDMMVEDCKKRGIKLVLTVAWHLGAWPDLGHESLKEFASNPRSKGRQLFERWVRDLVGRYKDERAVLFWELTNEANLSTDLAPIKPKGVIPPLDLTKPHAHIVRGPVVRDRRNNWTSGELAAFVRETAWLIKSLDKNHLVGTGFSMPRPSAWHLWLASLRRSNKVDWTRDSDEEQANYIRLMNPEPVDLVSFHFYLSPGAELERLALLKRVADEIEKPTYCGELGVSTKPFPGHVYSHPPAREGLRLALEAMRVLDVPLTLLWTWDEALRPFHEPVIWPDRDKEVVDILREAQRRASRDKSPARRGVSPEAMARLRRLILKFERALKEGKAARE